MEGVRQWAFSICCAMVACGIAQILLPKSGMEKIFRLCVSVFFLCCLLSPVVLQKPELRIELQELSREDIELRAARLEGVLEEQSGQAASTQLQKIVEDKLMESGIKYHRVTIDINTNGQHGDAAVAEVILDRQYETEAARIQDALHTGLGVDVKLVYLSGDSR